MRPIIGLTTYGRHELDIDYKFYDSFFAIPVEYVDAVRAAGGVPILLPPGQAGWEEILAIVDGVIVIGGADVDPSTYGGNAQHPALTRIDRDRDRSEIELSRLLVDNATLPTLCICRGMQVLNVALGGDLTEHIPDIQTEDIHRAPGGNWTQQPVDVSSHSRLAEVMQTSRVKTFSGHHQAIKEIAPGLSVAAVAPDGLIEAVEIEDHPWFIAVQWHPEMSAAVDPSQQRLFGDLVKSAATQKSAGK